jgi:hypothetical protein
MLCSEKTQCTKSAGKQSKPRLREGKQNGVERYNSEMSRPGGSQDECQGRKWQREIKEKGYPNNATFKPADPKNACP